MFNKIQLTVFTLLVFVCCVVSNFSDPLLFKRFRMSPAFRIHFSGRNECVTNEPQRTSAGRLPAGWTAEILTCDQAFFFFSRADEARGKKNT